MLTFENFSKEFFLSNFSESERRAKVALALFLALRFDDQNIQHDHNYKIKLSPKLIEEAEKSIGFDLHFIKDWWWRRRGEAPGRWLLIPFDTLFSTIFDSDLRRYEETYGVPKHSPMCEIEFGMLDIFSDPYLDKRAREIEPGRPKNRRRDATQRKVDVDRPMRDVIPDILKVLTPLEKKEFFHVAENTPMEKILHTLFAAAKYGI